MPDTPSPSTSVTPLQGKTTIDDKMFLDPERLSYESVVEIAKTIAADIHDSVKNKIVVIAGIRLLADFANLQAVYVLLDCLRRDYDSVAEQAQSLVKRRSQAEEHLESFVSGAAAVAAATIPSVLTPATAIVGAALGLISMFRQDVEYHGERRKDTCRRTRIRDCTGRRSETPWGTKRLCTGSGRSNGSRT
jgi:hypothetical protein